MPESQQEMARNISNLNISSTKYKIGQNNWIISFVILSIFRISVIIIIVQNTYFYFEVEQIVKMKFDIINILLPLFAGA